ncbi:hypothetical protein MF271_10005 [Deinococcus sp. KNUC1210]|uniref:hypothetical protein n=1 Tax=Deinococcus sp. KNUC1210 TaxID=2917691 RepID=UPI001EEFE9A4|nr:hypothetical protein [Deinococcus sp. KNUC1210]ULH14375.1 hypothetical protein MF271_10005 [Deinococcus sp. KNUC1210]
MTADRPEKPTPEQEMETAETHSGSSDVSHGMNSNLTPDGASTTADQQAAQEIEQHHQQDSADTDPPG